MANLGITPRMVVESMCRAIQESEYYTQAEKDNYIRSILEPNQEGIQNNLNELSMMIDEVIEGANNAISSAASFTVSVVTTDINAPVASAGVVNATIGSVSILKSSLNHCNTLLTQVINRIGLYRVPLPGVITTTQNLLTQAISAVNSIPIP